MVALAPKRFCATKGCPERVTQGHCQAHQRENQHAADLHRGSARERGYTTAWDAYSLHWLAKHPYCGERADGKRYAQHSRCVQAGQRTLAQVTDHIVPMSKGGAQMDDANSQSLCRACNTAKGDRP